MPVTLTQDAKDELARYAPRIRYEAYIIKNWYATATEIEITDEVHQYGEYLNDSTLISKDWTLPHLAMIVKNDGQYFNQYSADSIWQASPAKEPEECLLRIRAYVDTDTGEVLLLEYLGRITGTSIDDDEAATYVEIETVFAPGFFLQKGCTRRDGSWTHYDWSTGICYKTSLGGQIIPAPTLTSTVTSAGHSYFPRGYFYTTAYDICNFFEMVFRIHTTGGGVPPVGHEDNMQSYYNSTKFSELGAANVKTIAWVDVAAYMNQPTLDYGDIYVFNPISFEDVDPALCALDLLRYGAGLGTGTKSHIDETSFSNQSTYFTTQTPTYVLRAAVFDKTFTEGFLDLVGYMPEMFVWWSHDSKLTMSKHYPVLNAPTYKFEESLQNYAALRISRNVDRACNAIEVASQGVFIDNKGGLAGTDGWHVERAIEHRRDAKTWIPKKARFQPTDFSLTASPVDKLVKVDRPWFSDETGAVGDAWTLATTWMENYFKVWAQPAKTVTVVAGLPALEIEIGDKVGVNAPSRGLDSEVFVCASKAFDFDTGRVTLNLMQVTF